MIEPQSKHLFCTIQRFTNINKRIDYVLFASLARICRLGSFINVVLTIASHLSSYASRITGRQLTTTIQWIPFVYIEIISIKINLLSVPFTYPPAIYHRATKTTTRFKYAHLQRQQKKNNNQATHVAYSC